MLLKDKKNVNNKMNKKGNLDDIGQVGFILLGIFLILFITFNMNENLIGQFRANNQTNYTAVLDNADTLNTNTRNAWDYGSIFLAILILAFSYIAASKINIDAKQSIFAWLFAGFYILISMIVSNLYGSMIDNAAIGSFNSSLTFFPLIMQYLPLYSLIHLAIIFIGLYGKKD